MKTPQRNTFPTHQELMEYADGTIDPVRSREIDAMMERSSEVRREVELLRMMKTGIRNSIITPSRTFTANILSEVAPQKHEGWLFRMAKNSSNIFAMTIVLSMIGIAMTAGGTVPQSEQSIIAKAMDSFSSAVSSVLGGLGTRTGEMSQPIAQLGHSSSGKMILMAAGIFFLFVIADDLFGKRYSRIRK